MKYLLSPYESDEPSSDYLQRMPEIGKNTAAVINELREAGALVLNLRLAPATSATVVRPESGGGETLEDGPFSNDRAHAGGVWIISAETLDEALDWGKKAARALTLPVEIRPLQDPPTRPAQPA